VNKKLQFMLNTEQSKRYVLDTTNWTAFAAQLIWVSQR